MKRNRLLILVFTFIMSVMCFTDLKPFPSHAAKTGNVRAGFFSCDGYHMVDSSGKRSGYGYDYLQYLKRYTDFTYEYIGYEKDWNEMLDMLEAGEIDILTSAQKTEALMERFYFSELPIGNCSSVLAVNEGDSRYLVDDYKQLDGIRIGLLKGDSKRESLEDFAKQNEFSYQPVYFNDIDEMEYALHNGGKIDAVLTSSLRKAKKEWPIATFNKQFFYIIVKKGNRQLLDKINIALTKLQRNNPNLPMTLTKRYYSVDEEKNIAYTAKERKYIETLRNSGQRIKVTVNSGREPVSYFVNGEARGIIPEIAKEVLKRTGIPYEFVDTPPTVDARELLLKNEASVRFDGTSELNEAENYGFRVTEQYLQLSLSRITLKAFTKKPKSVAIIKNSDVVQEYVEKVFDKMDIIQYDSADECLKAVLTGKQDAAFLQTYIAQRLVNEDVKNRLKEQLVPGHGLNFSVAVNWTEPQLFSILEKAVISIGTEKVNHIVLEQTSYLVQRRTLLSYLYAHPFLFLIMLAAAACFIIILLLYLFRRKNLSLEKEKNRESERFISYVCRANDNVIEVDPENQVIKSYQVQDGKICCKETKFYSWDVPPIDIHPEELENVKKLTRQENMENLIDRGGELYFECRIANKGKAAQEPYRWFSFTFQGIPKDEKNSGRMMIFIKNINKAKEDEEEKRRVLKDALASAKRAGEAKGVFMSRMSHEIRTPLNAIIGYMTMAKSNIENLSKMGEYLEKSEFAAHHLLNIINDVLDISAIESGRMKIACETFNIRELLSGITSIFRTQAEKKEVGFTVKLNGLTQEELIGDPLRLNQILMNLLSNAVKFTPSGGQVTLTVFQKVVVRRRMYLQFEVADTGIGMTREYKKRLFQPFEQQDSTTAQKFGGTGLGLSITKNLVMLMEGTIDVESEENRGTRFTVNLPFNITEKSGEESDIYDFSGLRVLALYDRNSDYQYMKELLKRFGVTHDIVLNKKEALQKSAEKRKKGEEYDLCLIDWDALDINVQEAAEQIRADSKSKNPVIVAIAYEEPENAGQIDGVIKKPVFQSSMFELLSNLCLFQSQGKEKVEESYDLNGMRVLLAEDNPMNMEIAKEILETYGLLVDSAENGEEAVKRFEQSEEGTYQAVLMDIQMPIMNGYEAAQKIRSSNHPQAKSIVIIALTADAFAEDINRALAVGMNDHVSKPIDFKQLCKILSLHRK